jgi:hypothetical protein
MTMPEGMSMCLYAGTLPKRLQQPSNMASGEASASPGGKDELIATSATLS